MSATAVDAQGHPNAQATKDAGHLGVFAYIYNTNAAIVAAYHAVGLWVVPVAEFDTINHHPILDGAPAGTAHGQSSLAWAQANGTPRGVGFVATGDTNISESQFAAVGAYLDAFGAVLHPAGFKVIIYGGAELVKWCLTHGHADVGWVAGADSWNGNTAPTDASAVAHQRGAHDAAMGLPPQTVIAGTTCDINDLYRTDNWGQWWPDGVTPNPTPNPPDGDEMAGSAIYELPNNPTHWSLETGYLPASSAWRRDPDTSTYTPWGSDAVGPFWHHLSPNEEVERTITGSLKGTRVMASDGTAELDADFVAWPHDDNIA